MEIVGEPGGVYPSGREIIVDSGKQMSYIIYTYVCERWIDYSYFQARYMSIM